MPRPETTSRSPDLVVAAQAVAPGRAYGPLRRNHPALEVSEVDGAILLAERVRPEDMGRILAAAGTLTLGGALLSHVNLLSRELGKPSVALPAEVGPRLLPARDPGLLELREACGPSSVPVVLESGDPVLLDGDRGLLRIPLDGIGTSRRTIRGIDERLRRFASRPTDEHRLSDLVAAVSRLKPSMLWFVLDAALLFRAVPAGEPVRRLIRAFLDSDRGGTVRSAVRRIERRIVNQILERCGGFRDELDRIESPDELNRRRELLRCWVARERATLADIEADGAETERALAEVEERFRSRSQEIRGAVADEVSAALALPRAMLTRRPAPYRELLRRALEAGVESGEVEELRTRVPAPTVRRRASTDRELVVSLKDDAAAERERVGGKAVALMGFAPHVPDRCRVPPGFVITTAARRIHLSRGAEAGIRLAAAASADERLFSRMARAAVLSTSIPQELSTAVEREAVSRTGAVLAVRSSAVVEDEPGSSLAGLFDTYLGVRGSSELLDRIRRVWASAWSAHALRMLADSERSPYTVGLAVLVQEMVSTRSAGVMYTHDPDGLPGTLVVNAAWGLGEAVSMGRLPGDLFWVERRSGRLFETWTGGATCRIVPDAEGRGTRVEDLPPDLTERPCLDRSELSRLAGLARALEAVGAGPAAVEFGFDESGALCLFQVRPLAAGKLDVERD